MAERRPVIAADPRTDRQLLEHLVDRTAAMETMVAKVHRQQALIIGNVPILREVLGDDLVRELVATHNRDVREQAAAMAGGVEAWRSRRAQKRQAQRRTRQGAGFQRSREDRG